MTVYQKKSGAVFDEDNAHSSRVQTAEQLYSGIYNMFLKHTSWLGPYIL